uniref:BTB domain-containing protein n=1 Tax=Panagrellus redivivus TaxID=6233 RepID=A0A7E4UNW7_PANRE
MNNSTSKTTLEDSIAFTINKKTVSDGQTKSRVFPGSKNCEWTFSYYPAKSALSHETEKNHVRITLNFDQAVKGSVTIEAEGLPMKTSEFPKCHYVNMFYVHHDDFLAAIGYDLRLTCTVEIDVDFIPETKPASEKDTSLKFPKTESLLNVLPKTESLLNVLPKTSPAEEPPLFLTMFSGLRSLEHTEKLQNVTTLRGKILSHLRLDDDKIKWSCAYKFRYLQNESNRYRWSINYVVNDEYKWPVEISAELYQDMDISFNGKLIVEADRLPTKTYPITNCGKFSFDYLPYEDVYNVLNHGSLQLKFTLAITFSHDYVPEIRADFHDYNEVPTDFEIHCKDDRYEVHKDVLTKISPVFEKKLEHDFIETGSNMIEINDFDFATIEAVMNLCYGRPLDNISVGLTLDILYFAAKYRMTDITVEFESRLVHSLSITNFCAVLQYVNNCERTKLFAECAEFYKRNEDTIKTTVTFLALPGPLVNKLLKCAFQFKTEMALFYHARQKGICLDVAIDPSTIEIQTLADFFQVVPYAWKNQIGSLKVKCAQFYQQNKDEIDKSWEYKSYPKAMQQTLNILGRRLEARTDLREYENIPTDFEIQCGDNQFKVHKNVLSQISPVFEAMLRHNFVETSSNKIEINDFDFKTVETAMNICYGRPCGDLSTELVLDILYFADKYHIADFFTQLEVSMHNLSITNFCAVLRYANTLEKTTLFAECVAFYNLHKDSIGRDVAALPVPLVMKLLKAVYHLETELETFLRARKNRIRLDIEELEVPTLADFFKTVPYAWEKYEDGLKMKCAKFWQDNKDTVRKTEEYLSFSRSIKEELDLLGACFE